MSKAHEVLAVRRRSIVHDESHHAVEIVVPRIHAGRGVGVRPRARIGLQPRSHTLLGGGGISRTVRPMNASPFSMICGRPLNSMYKLPTSHVDKAGKTIYGTNYIKGTKLVMHIGYGIMAIYILVIVWYRVVLYRRRNNA